LNAGGYIITATTLSEIRNAIAARPPVRERAAAIRVLPALS